MTQIVLTSKAVRKFIVAQLKSRVVGGAAAVIVSTRVRDIPDDDIPPGSAHINVASPGNRGTVVKGSQAHLPRFDQSEDLLISCAIRLVDSVARSAVDEILGDAIDDLETEIFDALLTNRDVNQLAFSGYVVVKGGSIRAGSYRGDLVIKLTLEWIRESTPGPEPGSPDDDFLEVHSTIKLKDFDIWVTHDDDEIVTHDDDEIVLGGTQPVNWKVDLPQ